MQQSTICMSDSSIDYHHPKRLPMSPSQPREEGHTLKSGWKELWERLGSASAYTPCPQPSASPFCSWFTAARYPSFGGSDTVSLPMRTCHYLLEPQIITSPLVAHYQCKAVAVPEPTETLKLATVGVPPSKVVTRLACQPKPRG
jgi:hypothetical protein